MELKLIDMETWERREFYQELNPRYNKATLNAAN